MTIIMIGGPSGSSCTKRIGQLLVEAMFTVRQEPIDLIAEISVTRPTSCAWHTPSTIELKLFGEEAGWRNSLGKEANVQLRRKEQFKRAEAKRLKNAKPLKKTRVKGIVIAR